MLSLPGLMHREPIDVAKELGNIASYIGIVGGIATLLGWLIQDLAIDRETLLIIYLLIGVSCMLLIMVYLQRKEIKYLKKGGDKQWKPWQLGWWAGPRRIGGYSSLLEDYCSWYYP